jgi:hypothetical protein
MPRSDYKRLEERLVLVAWLNSLFGYEHNRDILKDLADVGEGVDSTGRSQVISRLLWVKEGKTQRIVFVEPHGMLHEAPPPANEKAHLHKRLEDDAGPGLKGLQGVAVDAFVVSRTPYDTLRKTWVHEDGSAWTRAECAAEHVLFIEREGEYDYIARILEP